MAILKQKKNKKFGYAPRYYKHEGEGSPFQMEQKFDKFRSTIGGNTDLKSKFRNAWGEFRQSKDKGINKTLFLLIALLVLIFLFIIDFDLSIFTLKP